MRKIAIVDDEQEERDSLQECFEQFQKENAIKLEIKTYCSGDVFLQQFDASYDLICLDIDMDGTNGIDTAKKIRQKDKEVLIFFVTNMAQMAIRGYEVRALDFIIKPVNYYSFAMKLLNALDIISNQRSKNIVLTTPRGMQIISSDELFFVEVDGHYLLYHTKHGEFCQKASLKDLEQQLEGLSFKRCNNCYLVNLKYVNGVEKEDVILQGELLKSAVHVKKSFYRHLQTIWEELRYDEILVKCFLYGRVDLCVSSFLKTCEEKKTFRTDCNGFKYKYVDFGRLL